MFVQIACKTMSDADKAIIFMYNGLKNDIQFIELSYVKNAMAGQYHAEPFETASEVLDRLEEVVDIETDNIGIYYNSGTKLIVRVFQGAKIPNNPDYMWEQKPNEV